MAVEAVPGVVFSVVNAVSFWANILLAAKTSKNIGRVSDTYLTALTPPGYTFGIWSLIYSLQLLFTIYGFYSPENKVLKQGVGWWYALASSCTFVWYLTFPRGKVEVAALATCLYFLCLWRALSGVAIMSAELPTYTKTDAFLIKFMFSVNTAWAFTAALLSILSCLMKWTGGAYLVSWSSIFLVLLFPLFSLYAINQGSLIKAAFPTPDPVIPLVLLWPMMTLIIDLRTKGSRLLPQAEAAALLLGLCVCALGVALCAGNGFVYNYEMGCMTEAMSNEEYEEYEEF